jgi:hypothetical protein
MKNQYPRHRANVLWAREESMIPHYQIHAERIKQADRFKEELLVPLEQRHAQLYNEVLVLEDELERLRREHNAILGVEGAAALGLGLGQQQEKKFIKKCTAPDCKGWLSTSWKCGLCSNSTCSNCLTVKVVSDEEHVCKPEDILTADEIKKSTRSCPKCGHAIMRSEGCDMMFCTSCNTPFSWKTGDIVTKGNIHNPHYYEWLSRQGAAGAGAGQGTGVREHGDIPCGGLPNARMLVGLVISGFYAPLAAMYRLIAHIEANEYNTYNERATTNNNRDYLVEYLLNHDTKESIMTKLNHDEQKRERARAIYNIYETFVVIGSEYMREVQAAIQGPHGPKGPHGLQAIVDKYMELIDFTNESFTAVADAYTILTPRIVINKGTWDWKIVAKAR